MAPGLPIRCEMTVPTSGPVIGEMVTRFRDPGAVSSRLARLARELAPNVHENLLHHEVNSWTGNFAMRQSYLWKWLPSLLGLACGLVAEGVRAEDPLALEAPSEVRDLLPRRGASPPSQGDAVHEVIRSPAVARVSEHIEKSPPSPINERPGAHPPGPNHQWIEGYWEWDKSRKDFVWVTGTWRVPPPGSFWVNSHWRRDETGWSRVSGFWSGRQSQKVDWRKSGPPGDRPEEAVGLAPGPDYFYVAGQYVPDGDGVVWKPGFWSRSQPGWEWAPARWVRQSSGWAFREGYWNRDSNTRERRRPQPGSGSSVRSATIVSTPAESGSPPLDAPDPASAGASPLLISADPPLTAPARHPGEASQPLDTQSYPIGSAPPPPLTSAAPRSPIDGASPVAAPPTVPPNQAYLDGFLGDGEVNPSASYPSRANGDIDFDLPAAGDTPVTYPQPIDAGNPTTRGDGLPRFAPGYVAPYPTYAPRGYPPSSPYYYRRSYSGGGLRNVVPRARGFLNRVLPR